MNDNIDTTCCALVLNGDRKGDRCLKMRCANGDRCDIHTNSMMKHGKYAIMIQEAKVEYERKLSILERTIDYNQEFWTAKTNLTTEFSLKLDEAEKENDGIDYIAQWKAAHKARRRERLLRNAGWIDENEPANQNLNENIREFAHDKQNVHTRIVVEQTARVVATIRKVEVPEEYRWNDKKCSKTPADIIATCGLSPDAAFQMMSKYCSSETIYEMEAGIYGKVLDSVWQFILKSDDKECLVGILKQEMEDNIGMCAQGNLSRLCNIVAGYMEGIQVKETTVEMLGRLFPPLMEYSDVEIRIKEAEKILRNAAVPEAEWGAWIDPLK